MASYLTAFTTAFPRVWSETVGKMVDTIGQGPTFVATALFFNETIGFWPSAYEERGGRCGAGTIVKGRATLERLWLILKCPEIQGRRLELRFQKPRSENGIDIF